MEKPGRKTTRSSISGETISRLLVLVPVLPTSGSSWGQGVRQGHPLKATIRGSQGPPWHPMPDRHRDSWKHPDGQQWPSVPNSGIQRSIPRGPHSPYGLLFYSPCISGSHKSVAGGNHIWTGLVLHTRPLAVWLLPHPSDPRMQRSLGLILGHPISIQRHSFQHILS